MAFYVQATPRIHPARRLRGLTYAYYGTDTDLAPEGAPMTVELGRPYTLGAWYARYPLATLFGLLGLGWAGGYFTWLWLGRRR